MAVLGITVNICFRFSNKRNINFKEILTVTKSIIVSLITALPIAAFGVFWMFVWLVGTNGYSEAKSGTILALNLLMVILSVIVSSVASGFLTNFLQAKTQWSVFVAAPLAIVSVTVVSVFVLFAGSLFIVGVVGQTR